MGKSQNIVFQLTLAMLRMNYSDIFHLPVCASVHPLTFSNDFSSEAPEAILLKFHLEPP